MVPRGEVGIVVANLALVAGVVSDALFAVILVAVVLTTVVAPYLLSWAIPRAIAEDVIADVNRPAPGNPGAA
jgi:Kef-type K+ transport system membrane component KefB